MHPDRHTQLVTFLSDPASHGTDQPVQVIRTHAAMVFLSGDTAYKIKQPVRYTYLDFSTVERRRAALQRELELNQPAAPTIYRDLLAVTETPDGALALGGDGPVVDWVLRMNRFPAEAELSEIAARGALDDNLAATLGRQIAEYHRASPVVRDVDPHELIDEILTELETEFRLLADILPEALVDGFVSQGAVLLAANAPLLRDRGAQGHVRRGHGDLHLRNLVCLDGIPVPFDALEFDEKLGTMDVLYDLAFLIMDMLHADQPRGANVVLNRYLYHAGQASHFTALSALPLFLAIRAAIRAMVGAQSSRLATTSRDAKVAEAQGYLHDALGFLNPPPPVLVAVGGLSGSGKTTLAARLAPELGAAPGAIHLRSDLARKAMFGVEEFTALPSEAYTKDISDKVYDHLRQRARQILDAGHSVVLDAVHLTPAERAATEDIAQAAGAGFAGLWLEADLATLVDRVSARRNDASDADAAVVRQQAAASVGAMGWERLDAGAALETLEGQAWGLIPAILIRGKTP